MYQEILTPPQFQRALSSRMKQSARLGDRRSYIGASEVGLCLRRVVASKLTPETFDLPSLGRMLAGRVMENEVIQLVRIALDGRLKCTGRNQVDAIHPEIPFHAHPDGRIVSDQGDGILEVKTASASAFKRYQQEGIPQHYRDQVQSQMGLTGIAWALVVVVSRENLSEIEVFDSGFDQVHFDHLVARARAATESINCHELPAGEPERGFCFNCPISDECPAFQERRQCASEGVLPEVLRLELECEMEELEDIEEHLDPLQKRATELRERVREAIQDLGINRITLDRATLQIIPNTRTSFDSKALRREAPELYTRFLKTSCFTNLRITYKGERACPSMAS